VANDQSSYYFFVLLEEEKESKPLFLYSPLPFSHPVLKIYIPCLFKFLTFPQIQSF
jgi:hypothetical protein